MKSFFYSFIILFSISLFTQVAAQTPDQKLYRMYVEDFDKVKQLDNSGVSIYNMAPGKYIEIMATPIQVEQLRGEGYEIEYLAKDFIELAPSMGLKAAPEYHDYQETMDEMADIASRFPEITKFDIIGQSVLGRNIACLKISDNPLVDEDETPILICGAHHGNEVLSVEATLYQINYLVNNYGVDEEVTNWINNYEIWFVPLVNPDGREAVRRTNENGIDLNRNYSFEHTAVGNHGEPFSEPETQAIRDLTAQYPPVMSLTYHTSGRYVLLAWTHTDARAPDSTGLIHVGNKIAESIVFPAGNTTDHYELLQGGRWYFTAGEYCDYMYATHNTVAFTVEMWNRQNPEASVIPQVVERNLEGFKTLLREASKSGVSGLIKDKNTGLPIAAEVSIPSIDGQGKLNPLLADATFGRYYKYLAPGTYEMQISAPGFRLVNREIVISEENLLILDVEMEPAPLLRVDEIVFLDQTENSVIGDGNGHANLSETLGLLVSVTNYKLVLAQNSSIKVSSDNPYLNLLVDSAFYGDISENSSITSQDTILFTIANNCPDGELIELNIQISDSEGLGWLESHSIEVFAPHLLISQVSIVDNEGNQDGVFDNGETVSVNVEVENTGRQWVNYPALTIETSDPYFSITKNNDQLFQINVYQKASFNFTVSLDETAPNLHMGSFEGLLTSSEGYTTALNFNLHNINGIFDDFEIGENGWVHGSYQTTINHHDDWQLGLPMGKVGDPASAYSGENCWGTDMGWDWYQNDTWNGEYQSSVYNYLMSPIIDCSDMEGVGLQFQRWLNTLTNDFGRVLVNDSVLWQSSKRGHSDQEWNKQEIDISAIADGNPEVRIIFELESNNSSNVGGWNIDDVIVANGLYSSSSTLEIPSENRLELSCFPNPFTDQIFISFKLEKSAEVNLQIFDAFGRIVKTYNPYAVPAGVNKFEWNGLNNNETKISQGIYFVKLSVNGQSQLKTIILNK